MDDSGSARTRRRIAVATAALALLSSGTITIARAQWILRGELARVLVVRLIRAKDPGAEQFYFVHEGDWDSATASAPRADQRRQRTQAVGAASAPK
jgi:hypothetical protein